MLSSFSQAAAHGAEPFRVFYLPQVRGHLIQPAVEPGRLFRREGGERLCRYWSAKSRAVLSPRAAGTKRAEGMEGRRSGVFSWPAVRRLKIQASKVKRCPKMRKPLVASRSCSLVEVKTPGSMMTSERIRGPLEFPQPLGNFRQRGGVQGLPGGELFGAQDLDQEITPLRVTDVIRLPGEKAGDLHDSLPVFQERPGHRGPGWP